AVAEQNLRNDFYTSAVNRAYYAIFYAANAMLATIGEARSKHSGVISLFRNRFVKTGDLPVELSDIYGRVLDNRQRGDYDLGLQMDEEQAKTDIEDARRFVDEVEQWLKEKNWL
ncbi:HEPN domain-containing protein, partial [bacterium]|nr:HEPN domain-containing protein [bacterium]